MGTSLLLNNGARVCCTASLAVRAFGCKDVIGVGDGDDASLYGNRATTETVWVATSIHPLVVIEHSQQLALEMPRSPEDAHPYLWVSLHHLPIRGVQGTVLVQDRVGDT